MLFCVEALELRGGTGCENAEDGKAPRLVAHFPRIEDGEMAEHTSAAVLKRHAEIALDPHLLQRAILGKLLLHAARVMAQPPADHVLAGCTGEIEFDVVDKPSSVPKGQGTHARFAPGEFGDEAARRTDGQAQITHQ